MTKLVWHFKIENFHFCSYGYLKLFGQRHHRSVLFGRCAPTDRYSFVDVLCMWTVAFNFHHPDLFVSASETLS